MNYKMNRIMILFILFVLACIRVPESCASASIVKQTVSSDGTVSYYVSTPEENRLVFSQVNARLDTEFRVVYSGKMLECIDYLQEALRYHNIYPNMTLNVSNGISSYYSYSMTQNKNVDGTITAFYHVLYLENKEQLNYVQNAIRTAIRTDATVIKTDYDKARWVYQWVIGHAHYDNTLTHFSAYDGLQQSGTVCSGYAALYCNIANELGLECAYVSGTVGLTEKVNHAWNIVKINGEWYCVDPTGGKNNYDKYFLKSKDTFSMMEYQCHASPLYDCYINSKETFAAIDYDDSAESGSNPIMPSVYNIEMDILRYNTINIGEGYTFLINNVDKIPINFVSENPDIAKVDKDGIITGVSEGVTTISAYNQELNIAQNCKITVASNGNNPVLHVQKLRLIKGRKTVIIVGNVTSGSKIKFVSGNNKIARIDEDTGEVTAVKAGKCKITCTITNGTSIYILKTEIIVK